MKKHLLFFVFIICLGSIFYYYPLLPIVFKETGYLFLTRVLPYLFVMMVMGEAFLALHLEKSEPIFIIRIISFLFNTSNIGSLIYFFSLFSGVPANIYFMKKCYQYGYISKEEIKHILSYSCYFNPLFLISILVSIFGHSVFTYILFFGPYLYGFLLGIIKRPRKEFEGFRGNDLETYPFYQIIQSIMNTILYVFGTIILFRVIFLFIPNAHFIHGLLEVTQGLIWVQNYSNSMIQYFVTAVYISFLGLSIFLQIFGLFGVIKKTWKRFILSRVNLLIIFLFILLLLNIIY